MADPITPAISDRICKHMNEDHAEAVLTYAKVYGKSPTAETAAMMFLSDRPFRHGSHSSSRW